jgi:hypothetical protein
LDKDLNNNFSLPDYDYFIYKNLKPNFYGTDLFIMKKKTIWKQLSINILSSKAVQEAAESLFESSYITFLNDQQFLSDILDNINFFNYKTDFASCSNKNSLKIYEYGLYFHLNNKCLSLLLFYAFNNISNVHEISGHINIFIQNLYNTDNNSFESPKIEGNMINLYSQYAKKRGKESGETIEILLFGKMIQELTIKEALFILEPLNYKKGKEDFKKRFKKCNNYEIKDIVSKDTVEIFLKPLGINIHSLPHNQTSYPNEDNLIKIREDTTFKRGLNNHPPEFYYNFE